jgi:hypothetical protein
MFRELSSVDRDIYYVCGRPEFESQSSLTIKIDHVLSIYSIIILIPLHPTTDSSYKK